jgi:formate dehydrogenase iron-sulfur subunit
MGEKGFLSDSTLCIGCGSCQTACKEWNNLKAENAPHFSAGGWNNPAEFTVNSWSRVKFDASGASFNAYHLKCFHCFDPQCMKVCPEKAIYQSDDWTVIDTERCIGCLACVKACPYDAVRVDPETKKAAKCHGCILNPSTVPPCAAHCPTGALKYDYRKKLIKHGMRRVAEVKKISPGMALCGLSEQGGLGMLMITDRSIEKAVKTGMNELYDAGMIYSLMRRSVPNFAGVKRILYRLSSYIARKG